MLLTCLASLLLAVLPHPNSFSSSRVAVTGADVRLELRCQAQSLLEAFGPGVDRDGDGWFSDDELRALRDPLLGYVNAHYVIRVGSGGDGEAGTVLPGALTELGAAPPDMDVAWPTQWVDLSLEYHAAAEIPDVLIEVSLFRDKAPDHRDLCQLVWNGSEPLETLFWMSESRRYYAPPAAAQPGAATRANATGEPGASRDTDASRDTGATHDTVASSGGAAGQPLPLGEWVGLGVRHILTGWDHIAFVVALIMAAGSVRSLLGVVTAFTLAHSVTLALAALQVVHVSSAPVEVLIALSIAWVGAVTLFARRPHARWPEAFAFGLVHGLGFAGFLGQALAGESHPLRALVGFNLGVEVGQLCVVAAVVGALALLRAVLHRASPSPSPSPSRSAGGMEIPEPMHQHQMVWLAPSIVRRPICTCIVAVGLIWIVQRLGA